MTSGKLYWRIVLGAIFAFAGCSGGGGGGGSSGGTNSANLHRTSGTGVRVIHAALHTVPVSLRIGGSIVQTARYGESTQFVSLPQGPQSIDIEMANSAGTVLARVAIDAAKDTEYNIILSNDHSSSGLNVETVADEKASSTKNVCRFRLANYVSDGGTLTATNGVFSTEPVRASSVSAFMDIASGDSVVSVLSAGGTTMLLKALNCPDRGEQTLVVSGSADLGVRFAEVFPDLD